MNIYVVGDIHGWNDPLVELLNRVNFDYDNDRLISLGDLCDRGTQTWEVIETLLKLKNLILIRGNHDPWLLEWLKTTYQDRTWIYNGGMRTVESYISHKQENIDKHIELLDSAVAYFIEDKTCFVHGGFDKDYPIKSQDPETLCWDRELVMQSMSCKGKRMKLKFADDFNTVFIGHTPTLYWDEPKEGGGKQPIMKPIYAGGVWNLDTGCGKGGPLTLFNLTTKEYIQSNDRYPA